MEDYEIDCMARIVSMHTGRMDWEAEALQVLKMKYVCLPSHKEISFDFDVSRKRRPFGIFDPSEQAVRIHIAAISKHRNYLKRNLRRFSEEQIMGRLAYKYLYTDTHETLHAILWKWGAKEYDDETLIETVADRMVSIIVGGGLDCNWIVEMLFPERENNSKRDLVR